MDLMKGLGGILNGLGDMPDKEALTEKAKPGAGRTAAPAEEFCCRIKGGGIDADAKATIGDDALVIVSLFDQLALPYIDISNFEQKSYGITLKTQFGEYVLSHMGQQLDHFYLDLVSAYDAMTLKSLFVEGTPILKAEGDFKYRDLAGEAQGRARIRLYDDCVCILSDSEAGRRVPICFISGLSKENYHLTITLDTGESYELMRMAQNTEPFVRLLEGRIMALRDDAIKSVRATDPACDAVCANRIAKLMPEGVAAGMAVLRQISPSFAAAVEERVAASRAADTYAWLKSVCGDAGLYVGMKSGLAGSADADTVWIIAAANGVAAVEFATGDEAAATFIYRYTGKSDVFALGLNHALEAIDFHREIISMTEDELCASDKQHYRMAVRRNGAVTVMRACFAGRVIHSTPEAWQRSVDKWFNAR